MILKGVAIQAEGEAYTNFTGSIRTKATLKHYLFLLEICSLSKNAKP
jgi:hypothetical protein